MPRPVAFLPVDADNPGPFGWVLAAAADPRALGRHVRGASANSVLALVLLLGLGVHFSAAPFDPPLASETWLAFLLKSAALALPLGVARWCIDTASLWARLRLCGVARPAVADVFAAALLLNLVNGLVVIVVIGQALLLPAPVDALETLEAISLSMGPLLVFRAWLTWRTATLAFGALERPGLVWFLVLPTLGWVFVTALALA